MTKSNLPVRILIAVLCVAPFAACGDQGAPATNTAAPTAASNATSPAAGNKAADTAGDVGTPEQQKGVKDVAAALDKAGFKNIQVFLKSNTIQIKGTVPSGKRKEAMDIARNAAGMNATMIEIYEETKK